MQMIPLLMAKWKGTKEFLDESEKDSLNSIIGKKKKKNTKIMASGPITSWQIEGEKEEAVTDFLFLGSKNHCGWWLKPWN